MQKWKASVRLPSNALQEVFVEANNYNNAKQMLEAIYGKGQIMNLTQAH